MSHVKRPSTVVSSPVTFPTRLLMSENGHVVVKSHFAAKDIVTQANKLLLVYGEKSGEMGSYETECVIRVRKK